MQTRPTSRFSRSSRMVIGNMGIREFPVPAFPIGNGNGNPKILIARGVPKPKGPPAC